MSEQVQANRRPGLWYALRYSMRRRFGGHGLWPPVEGARPTIDQLGVREAYRLWAPTYASETATSTLDEQLAQEMLYGLPRTRLLDAGCGIGRRIKDIPGAIGIDASSEMLAAGGESNVIAGDIRSMPFASRSFDMVWCRLVLGHMRDALPAYRELARVCLPGGYIFVTDFHPDAAAAGHRRTFTDQSGRLHEIEHYIHGDHIDLAAQAGLSLTTQRDGAVGQSVRSFYMQGLGRKAYKRDLNLKLVAAFLYRRLQ
jgi:malonyl-CoA O-methyltransferase